jgi:hypothetical protein
LRDFRRLKPPKIHGAVFSQLPFKGAAFDFSFRSSEPASPAGSPRNSACHPEVRPGRTRDLLLPLHFGCGRIALAVALMGARPFASKGRAFDFNPITTAPKSLNPIPHPQRIPYIQSAHPSEDQRSRAKLQTHFRHKAPRKKIKEEHPCKPSFRTPQHDPYR